MNLPPTMGPKLLKVIGLHWPYDKHPLLGISCSDAAMCGAPKGPKRSSTKNSRTLAKSTKRTYDSVQSGPLMR